MSRVYENIKYLAKTKGIKIADLEQDHRPGYISYFDRDKDMMRIPLGSIYAIARKLGVTIEDLVEKDFANETELDRIRRQIRDLKIQEQRLVTKELYLKGGRR